MDFFLLKPIIFLAHKQNRHMVAIATSALPADDATTMMRRIGTMGVALGALENEPGRATRLLFPMVTCNGVRIKVYIVVKSTKSTIINYMQLNSNLI